MNRSLSFNSSTLYKTCYANFKCSNIILFSFILSFQLTAQSFKLDVNSFGFIENNSKIIGSGFVLDSANQVITCAHVILNQEHIYFKSEANKSMVRKQFKLQFYQNPIFP